MENLLTLLSILSMGMGQAPAILTVGTAFVLLTRSPKSVIKVMLKIALALSLFNLL